MSKIAVFPGSFDPFTIGHESVVRRALPLFDKIIVAVGSNTQKKSFLSTEGKVALIRDVFSDENKISVAEYEGLTIDFCIKVKANFILRGLRTSADFEYERAISHLNKSMSPELETVFILTAPEHSHIFSTIVREILIHGGDATKFIPRGINLSKYMLS
jgi:pantetheine-phosphate adenylyltransferase